MSYGATPIISNGTGGLFRPLLEVLPEGTTCEVVNYPVDEALGYPKLTDLVRERLSDSRPTVIVAESFSGPVGIKLAAEGSPGLKGLVLVSTFAVPPRSRLWRFVVGSYMF